MAPTLSFANVEQQFGCKWHFYHRVDMHRHLREMAEAAGAIIRLGCQVMDCDPDSGIIGLKDGTKVQKDLVVIADGQHVSRPSFAAFCRCGIDHRSRIVSTPRSPEGRFQ